METMNNMEGEVSALDEPPARTQDELGVPTPK